MNLNYSVCGQWMIRKFDRATGLLVEETPWEDNVVTTAGRNIILDRLAGLPTIPTMPAPLSAGVATLRVSGVFIAGASMPLIFVGSVNNTPLAPSSPDAPELIWEWRDESVNQYTVQTLDVFNNTSASGNAFSTASPTFSGGNTKPANQNWHYRYRLTLVPQGHLGGSYGFMDELGTPWEGVYEILRLLIGPNSSRHLSQMNTRWEILSSYPMVPTDESGVLWSADFSGTNGGVTRMDYNGLQSELSGSPALRYQVVLGTGNMIPSGGQSWTWVQILTTISGVRRIYWRGNSNHPAKGIGTERTYRFWVVLTVPGS
jgi:hypothetical protein